MRGTTLATAAALALLAGAGPAWAEEAGKDADPQSRTALEHTERAQAEAPAAELDSGIHEGVADPEANPGTTAEGRTGRVSLDDLIGRKVVAEDGEMVGEVADIVVGANGRAEWLLIEQISDMGLSGKEVAVEFSRIRSGEGEDIRLSGMTRDEVAKLPEFEPPDDATARNRSK